MPTPIRHPLSAFATPVAAATLLMLAGSAQAANLGFLRDTPISYMKPRDIGSIKKAVFDELDNKQDGDSSTWNNDGLGNPVKLDATLKVDSTQKTGARTCRTVAVTLNGKGQSMNLLPVFCREGSAAWQLQKR
jgi:hypothetical protein